MPEMGANTLATVLVLTSALLHASWNAWLKRCPDKLAINSFFCVIGGLAFVPVAFFVPLPSGQAWVLIAFSTAVHCIYQFFLIRMLDKADFTVGYPIARGMGPLIVTMASFWLWPGMLDTVEIIAIFTVISGIMLTGYMAAQGKFHGIHQVPSIGLALVTGLCIGTYTLIDSSIMKLDENFLTLLSWMNITFAPAFLAVALMQRGPRIFPQMLSSWRTSLPITLIAYCGYTMALLAFRFGTVAEVAALRETSIVFAALIGFWLLKEQFSRGRLLSCLMIAAGAILMKIA